MRYFAQPAEYKPEPKAESTTGPKDAAIMEFALNTQQNPRKN